jgi:hypothetical protein
MVALALMPALPRQFAGLVLAAPSDGSQCSTSENDTVARMFIDVGEAHKLYAAARRDRIELQRRYPLDEIAAMISRGDDVAARQSLDARLNLLNRALDETERAKEAGTRVHNAFASLSMGCRQAMIAAISQ